MSSATVQAPRTSVDPFGAWSERHAGDSLLVCGCGNSLNQLPHDQGLPTIGVNDVGRLFDPTYLVVVNPPRQFRGDRFEYVRRSRAQALFTQLDLGPVQPPVVRFALGRHGGTEIGPALHYTQNSPYVAVCLAAYMGARRIGLIGVDFTDHHFFAATGRHPLTPRLAQIDREYAALAAGLAAQGVELVNLSAQSRLQSLRKQPLADWLAGAQQPAAAGHPRVKLDLVPAPAIPAPPPDPSPSRLFIVGFRFLTCGDVVSDGLQHAAQALNLPHARAEWDDPALPQKVEAFRPDWLLVVHGRRFVQRWRQCLDGWRRAVWLMDEPYEVDDTAAWSSRFDAVFVNDASTLARHPQARVLPLAFDPRLHLDPGHERVHRVGFIGGANPSRERLLLALAEAGLLSYLVGGPWSDPRLKRLTLAARISPAETAALYQRTQIVVNVFRDQHQWNRGALPATAMNPRIYEAMACGAVLVSEPRPELHTVFPHLPCFEDAASLLQQVRALLDDPAAMARLRAQGLAAVAPHRYADRLQQALAVMAPAPAALASATTSATTQATAPQLDAAQPQATLLALPPAALARPAANHSPPGPASHSERQPLHLPPLPAAPRRHLMYHLWPVRGSTWRWNVQQLLQRIELFNGRRLIGIVTDERSESAAAVMELLAGHGCEFVVQPNGPAGEAATFPLMLQMLQTESRQDVAFYAHAKGVKYEPQFPPAVRRWAEVQYAVMLDHWGAVRAQLQTHAMTGLLRRVGRFANHQHLGDWHYSGTFFWMRHDAVFARPWQQVPAFYGAVEAWPGLMFTRQEAACLLLDQLRELPYHPRFWSQRGDPALAQWRRSQRPLPVPPDLAHPPGFEGQALPRLEHKPEEFAWLMQRLRAAGTQHLLVITPSASGPQGQRTGAAAEDAAAWHARRHFAAAGLALQVSTLAGGSAPAPGLQPDAVLIDGDHGYASCRRDLMTALALQPRLVALHDTVDSDWHAAMGCCVSRLWTELLGGQVDLGKAGTRLESVAGSDWAGVGLLHLER